MGTTIFAEMTALAVPTGAVNLGQGFPDTDGPHEIAAAAAAAIMAGRGNQYPPRAGIPKPPQALPAPPKRFSRLPPAPPPPGPVPARPPGAAPRAPTAPS